MQLPEEKPYVAPAGSPMTFHVLPGLPHDVISGQQFADQMDAFNTYPNIGIRDTGDWKNRRLIALIDKDLMQKGLRNASSFKGRSFEGLSLRDLRKSTGQVSSEDQLALALESQIYRASLAERARSSVLDPTILTKII